MGVGYPRGAQPNARRRRRVAGRAARARRGPDGKLARPKAILFAPELPKTHSGEIMRRLLRDIADGRDLGDVTTLSDPSVVETLHGAIAQT